MTEQLFKLMFLNVVTTASFAFIVVHFLHLKKHLLILSRFRIEVN